MIIILIVETFSQFVKSPLFMSLSGLKNFNHPASFTKKTRLVEAKLIKHSKAFPSLPHSLENNYKVFLSKADTSPSYPILVTQFFNYACHLLESSKWQLFHDFFHLPHFSIMHVTSLSLPSGNSFMISSTYLQSFKVNKLNIIIIIKMSIHNNNNNIIIITIMMIVIKSQE